MLRRVGFIVPDAFAGRLAVVTGASSGIGRAIAVALARRGARICAIGRDIARLRSIAAEAGDSPQIREFRLDLAVEEHFQSLLEYIDDDGGKVDFLIHCAGVIQQAPLERACVDDLDAQYRLNVRAPYILTHRLLPGLLAAHGQVVFINSSAGLTAARPDVGQYAATKHGLKAIADSLREEINARGVRVTSVFTGRTATPMQAAVHELEGKPYRPERLLQPGDIALLVVHVLAMPPTAEITDVSIRPMLKT